MNARWWRIVVIGFLSALFLDFIFTLFRWNPLAALSSFSKGYPEKGSPLVSDFGKLMDGAAVFLLIIFLVAIVALLFDAIRPWKHSRETIIQLRDLSSFEPPKNQTKTSESNGSNIDLKKDRALTELFAAKLRKIISVHDLAYQYCRIHFRNQGMYNSATCADMTSVLSQVDIKTLFFEEPNRLAIGSSPFNDDLGQISSKVGPVEASFSLRGLVQFFQSRNGANIHITGSIQEHKDGPRVVAQLSYSKQSWAWDINPAQIKDIASSHTIDIPDFLEELAYHVTNRIMGQTSQLIDALPGDHFEKYSKLLSEFIFFIQAESPELQQSSPLAKARIKQNYNRLTHALHTFLESEPTDIRSYYMLYIIGIIAIGRREYSDAQTFLEKASIIEPSVVATILQASLPLRQLKWRRGMIHQLPNIHLLQRKVSKPDRARALELAKGLANVNAALGFSIELTMQRDHEKKEVKSFSRLEQAADAYQRAFDYKSDDPLLVSNLADVKLKMSDALQPKDYYLDHRLRLRTEAQQLLNKACHMKRNDHRKYAYLRMGHYQLRRGDLKQAEHYFVKAWKADQSFLVAARNLASIHSMRRNHDKAIEVCNQALQEAGGNRSHYLMTKQIHAWIHNSRGWAYLKKAKEVRSATSTVLMDSATISECGSWLNLAEKDFNEAISLLTESSGQQSIPQLNLFFTFCEKSLLANTPSTNQLMERLVNILSKMQSDSYFAKLYRSLLSERPESFGELFQSYWSQQAFVPAEYLGILADLQLLKSYFESQDNESSCDGNANLKMLVRNLGSAIDLINEYLPSCFLGLQYLWSGHPERAVTCWKKRLDQLKRPTKKQLASKVTSNALNYELWSYLYQGLMTIFTQAGHTRPPEQSLPLFKKVFSSREKTITRQYAQDLLTEARQIGEILIQGGYEKEDRNDSGHGATKQDLHDQRKRREQRLRELRHLFHPINQRYYFAIKQNVLLYVSEFLESRLASCLLQLRVLLRRMTTWMCILFSS